MQSLIDILSSPTILISAIVIGAFGEAAKKAVEAFKTPPMYDENGHILSTLTVNGRAVTYRDSAGKAVPPPDPLWIRIFDATLPAQPVLVGLLLGLIPWLPAEPSLTKEGYEFAGHLMTYGSAGILCKVAYDVLITTIRRFVNTKANQVLHTLDSSASVEAAPGAVNVTTATTEVVVPTPASAPTPPPAPATDPNPSQDSTVIEPTDPPPAA